MGNHHIEHAVQAVHVEDQTVGCPEAARESLPQLVIGGGHQDGRRRRRLTARLRRHIHDRPLARRLISVEGGFVP